MAVMQRWLEYFAVFAVVVLVTLTACCVKGAVAKHPPRMRALCSVPRWRLLVFLPIVVVLAIFASRKNPPPGGGIPNALPRLLQQLAGDPPGLRQFTDDEKAARFVLQRMDVNAEWSAAMPSGAVEPTTWALTGAFSDKYENLPVGGWEFPYGGAFPFGTNEVTRMAFLAQGEVRPDLRDESTHISPLAGVTSIPRGDRLATAGANFQSRFWTLHTPTNALYTWENNLFFDRTMPTYPVSFQIEMFPNGNFTLRHDISSLDDTAWQAFTNVVRTGAQWHGHGEMIDLSLLPKYSKAEFRYHALDERDLTDPDRDGDGITTADEIFIYHTDPENPDTDYDGLSDLDEIFGYHTDPLNPNSLSQLYSDGFAVKLGDLDPFSYPPNSTNTVLEHIFYSGTTNGAFAYPQSTEDVAVLKISVSGTGTGSLVVGDSVVPLVAPPQMRSGVATNTLLLNVGYGVKKLLWYRRPEGLDVALDSNDFLIGELPSFPLTPGWIAFPHTEATIPCIHDLSDCRRTVRLVHGEEFSGLTATWESSAQGVTITNNPPVSAEVRARIPKNENRSITYTVAHPKWLRGCTTFEQTLRFCPPMTRDEEAEAAGSEDGFDDGDAPDPDSSVYSSAMGCACGDGGCACCNDGWCVCRDINCTCNLDRVSELTLDEAEAAEAYTNIVVSGQLTHIENVLHLHKENRDIVHLDVPGGDRGPCCPCPEHQNTNYVAKSACSRRLNVNWPSGERFSISHATCNVDVEGKSPSFDFRDSRVLFVTNGAPYKSGSYTVLGVDIDTELWRWPSFNDYEALSPGLGFPMTVCTNLVEAPGFVMRTDVFLSNGVVRVALENVQGEFKVWLAGWDSFGSPVSGTTELLLSSGGTVERHMPIERWRSIMRRYGGVRNMYILVTSSQAGNCDLVFEYACAKGDEYVHDVARRRITSVNPPLRADYDRNGLLDGVDAGRFIDGRSVYFWRNGDKWRGDDAFSGVGWFENSSDGEVNGRNDLVNFLPLAVDVSAFATNWSSSQVYYRIETYYENLTEAKLALLDSEWSDMTGTARGEGFDLAGNAVHVAPVAPLGGGTNLPPAFVELSCQERAVMLMEFPEASRYGFLQFTAYSADGDVPLFTSALPLHVGDVGNMIAWLNLRSAAGGSGGVETRLWTDDWPESEHEPGNVVFVHGYNMAEDAEVPPWAENVFKKLWWSGLDRGYVAVQWRGNEGQIYVPGNGWTTPNYYGNVQNAFATAYALKDAMDNLFGPKWFIAHSLGNMLVSAAIQDYGMEYEKFFMLNAAVAMEAFDPIGGITQESHDKMTPAAWTNYTDRVRSTHWFERFPDGDGRRLLTWKGRFANVTNIVNFYSTQEEVVNNGDGDWHTITKRNYVWYNQETRKGLWPMMLHEYEGGWEFNPVYDTVTGSWLGNEYVEHRSHMPPGSAAALTDPQLQQTPFFLDFHNPEMHTSPNGAIVATNYLYRAEMLAYAIPAESFAVGANPLSGLNAYTNTVTNENIPSRNFNMASFIAGQEDLPENEDDDPEKRYRDWQHSTFVQRSYKRTSRLYKEIISFVKGEK